MSSAYASEPGGRTGARQFGGRAGQARRGVPLWPGMIPLHQQVGQRAVPPRSAAARVRGEGAEPFATAQRATPQRIEPRRPVRQVDPHQSLWPARASRPHSHRKRGRRPWFMVSVAGGASLAAVAVVAVYTAQASGPTESSPTVVGAALGGGPGCEAARTGEFVRGNGVGSTESGPDVILAFQHAYYVQRSGAAARALTAPDALVPAAAMIDKGIASVPEGTRHCVLITPMPDGRFDVVITDMRPDASVRTYRQFVTVAVEDGAMVITRIAPPT
ncbi:hypothetical protein ACFVMC_11480 [Nocardia sp. NPDC127579]|uniref:hypothetical protein n=1 Tax=Nocardia sp. NPDC127579 TaxID=3345402 RepID=UPI003624D64C